MLKYRIFLLLLSVMPVLMHGQQLCDGNLGINIFNDGDFGSGTANVVQQDPNIAPGYIYSSSASAPRDGYYLLTNNTGDWSSNYPTWLNIGDNSNDLDGYMMVDNASFQPGLFYTQQVLGLCENTLYEFSADIINLIRIPITDHIKPNIDFLLDDIVRFSTGDVPQDAEWHQYGFTFTTDPGQTSIKLSLRNKAPGGNGNDLALDNIAFQACGPDAFVSAERTIFLCENDNIPTTIQAEITAANQSIQWQTSIDSISWTELVGATGESIIHDNFDVGKYYYRYITAGSSVELANEKCRIISDVIAVDVLSLEYEISDTICANESYPLGSQLLSATGDYNEAFISSRGCDSFVSLALLVLEEEIIELDTSLIDPICYGDSNGSIELSVVNGELSPYTYAINEVATSMNFFEGLTAGDYAITITNKVDCESIVDLRLEDPEAFIISLPADTVIDLGETLDVIVTANQSVSTLLWNPEGTSPCGTCLEFNFLPLQSGTYAATATNENDCESSDEFQITINIDDLDVYIPNTFDPSLSGVDKGFTIGAKPGLIKTIKELNIYDRWGNLIHRTTDTKNLTLWDGRINDKEVNPGVYVYLLTLELIDGNEYNFAGDLVVIK